MTTTINADNVTGGAIVTGDASGQLGLQAAGVTKLTVSSSGVTLASALPIASGGTGTTSTTFANLTTNVTGTLPVANGGTNSTATPTAGGAGYGTGTAHAYTAAGMSGQLLQSNGASAPSWVTASAGAMVYLSTVTASSASTVSIETTFDSTYDTYMIVANDVTMSADQLWFLMKIGGSYVTSSYSYLMSYSNSTGGTNVWSSRTSDSDGLTSKIRMTNANNGPSNFTMYVYTPTTSSQKTVSWFGTQGNSSSYVFMIAGSGGCLNSSALSGIQFNANTGNVSGTFRVYGIAKS